MLYEAAAALVLAVLEIFPHRLYMIVVFQVWVAFHVLNAVVHECLIDLYHHHAVHTLAAVFIPDPNQV